MSEVMEVDILIVGGGSAGLSCALRIFQCMEEHKKNSPGEFVEPNIVVLEKASEVGAHSLSGAILNPVALKELIPDFMQKQAPIETEVLHDSVYYLGKKSAFRFPITPPPFHNEGNVLISIAKFNRWLGKQCEDAGIQIFPGFAAVDAIYENGKLVGVRTGDKGRDKNGAEKANFEAGLEMRAKVTIFAEGTRGSLFKKVAKQLDLRAGTNPEVFEEGVKEVIQMPPGTVKPGQVIHTLGFPLHETVGGTFIYTYPNDQIVVGLVGYLDTRDPLFDPHRELQRLKTHPFMQEMLKGGKVIAYGGKTLPAGGWFSMPKLYADGMLVVGDCASMVDVKKLKGIHLAMKSGMLAGETAFAAYLKQDYSEQSLKVYKEKIDQSVVKRDLWATRNFHQALSKGLIASFPFLAAQELTGGRGFVDRMEIKHRDLEETESVVEVWGAEGDQSPEVQLPKPDGILFFDKLSSVYLTGTMHNEDSPCHLIVPNRNICSDECYPKYRSPCNHFCPANVYEMVDDVALGKKRLQINFTNCIHCKTCDIKCPADNIEWTAPEGGGGPNYKET